MVSPITGPIAETTSIPIDGPGSFYEVRNRYRQKRPFDLVLPYSFVRTRTTAARTWGERSFGGMANASAIKSPWQMYASYDLLSNQLADYASQAQNIARGRFSAKLGEEAGWLLNLAQRAQAMDMIYNRAMQLYLFCRQLRRFDFPAAARTLGIHQDPRYHRYTKNRLRRTSRAFSSNFLEFHFGWSPLVGDVGASIELLDGPIPFGRVYGQGRVPIEENFSRTLSFSYGEHQKGALQGFVSSRVGAEVHVTNANLWLANRLGLTNPALVAWDAVPWSFVVDWFVNVSDYLGQFTEFNGVALQNAFTTTYARVTGFGSHIVTYYNQGYEVFSESIYNTRVNGIPGITLGIRPPWRLSPTRAAAAISLLIQRGIRSH